MTIEFDLQRHGGGGSQTTKQERDIPPAGENEQVLEGLLTGRGEFGLAGANALWDDASTLYSQTYNPNWGSAYSSYANAIASSTGDYKSNLESALRNYASAMNQYNKQYTQERARINQGLESGGAKALSDYERMGAGNLGFLSQGMGAALSENRGALSSALNDSIRQGNEQYDEYQGKLDTAARRNYDELYGALNDRERQGDVNLGNYQDALSSAQGANEAARASALSSYTGTGDALQGQYRDTLSSALADSNAARAGADSAYLSGSNALYGKYTGNADSDLSSYRSAEGNYLGGYENALANALSNYNRGMEGVQADYGDLANGVLPSAYATNRQRALNADLGATVGAQVNSLANRGVINSSVANKALGDISQNASDTLAKNYQSDLSLAASLLGQKGGNISDVYNTNAGNANTLYGNQANAARTVYGNESANTTGQYDRGSDLLGAQRAAQVGTADTNFANATGTAGNIYNSGSALNDAQYQSRVGDANTTYQNAATNAGNVYSAANDQANTQYQNRANTANTVYGNEATNAGDVYNAGSNLTNTQYQNKANTANTNYQNASGTVGTIYGANTDYTNNLYNNRWNNLTGTYDRLDNSNNNWYGNMAGSANQLFNNSQSAYTNAYNADMASANSQFTGAATAQQNSYSPVSQVLNYSDQLASPGTNLYNQMYSGRMGTGTVTSTTSGGNNGIWGAVGGLGSAAIAACFTGNTLVATPDGYKKIKDIETGDAVLSLQGGNVVAKTVTETMGPVAKPVMEVLFENGTKWETTLTQRGFDGKHFHYVDGGTGEYAVHNGKKTRVARSGLSGRVEMVYDIRVEGFAGENVFFANDVAAEGIGD